MQEERDERRVALPGGRELLVRRVRPSDIDALVALYDALDPDDRYRRFFSLFHPDRAFYDRLVGVADRDGCGLVATIESADGTEQIVGEANYTRLENGDGELAIAVDERWRGWLGPYLLDALLGAAAAGGVPNLEADILAINQPMVALARSRDCLFAERSDPAVIRAIIGTAPSGPAWPDRLGRLRVLVEGVSPGWHADALRAAGLELLTCRGPATRRRPCPAMTGGRCLLAEEADVIVVRPTDGDPSWTELADAHRSLAPEVPVSIDASAPTKDEGSTLAFVRQLAANRVRTTVRRRSGIGGPADPG